MHCKNYEKALQHFIQLENLSTYQKVKSAYRKGICLYELQRYSLAIAEFNFVIDNGNTLEIVNETKEKLFEIKELDIA
ncbi:MAG: hypothetical protein ACK5LC_03565 [Coprobacillaceae bacterium]